MATDSGTPLPAEGQAAGVPARSLVLSRLEAERRQALGCYEYQRAAELAAQINRLSQGSASSPAKETTAARRPARSRT